jgi:hypothetical protein
MEARGKIPVMIPSDLKTGTSEDVTVKINTGKANPSYEA